MLSPIQSELRQDIPTTNLSDIKDTASNNNNVMLVSISSQKNPVARGDTQNTTITVTDSVSKAIANADVDGKLIYPGDNYEKDFKGKNGFTGQICLFMDYRKERRCGTAIHTSGRIKSSAYLLQ